MSNLTLAIPDDLRAKMRKFPEINWSEVARQAIAQKARILDQMGRLLSKSNLTEDETIDLGREIKKRSSKRPRA